MATGRHIHIHFPRGLVLIIGMLSAQEDDLLRMTSFHEHAFVYRIDVSLLVRLRAVTVLALLAKRTD